MWSWSSEGARLIPECVLEGCVVEVLIPALYGVLMREVGAKALWWCSRETGDAGAFGWKTCVGESGGRVCWTVLMDRNLGLWIDSAVLVICCAQEGAEKASGAGVRSAWGGFGRLAPVLAERERSTCLFGAGLIPVFGECWCVVARLGFWAEDLSKLRRAGDGGAGGVLCGVSLRDGSVAVGFWCVRVRVMRAGLGWFRHVGRPVLAQMPDILYVCLG